MVQLEAAAVTAVVLPAAMARVAAAPAAGYRGGRGWPEVADTLSGGDTRAAPVMRAGSALSGRNQVSGCSAIMSPAEEGRRRRGGKGGEAVRRRGGALEVAVAGTVRRRP